MADNSCLIEYDTFRFFISDPPEESQMVDYVALLKSYNINHVVRTTPSTYSSNHLTNNGIKIYDLVYSEKITDDVLRKWMDILTVSRNTIAIHGDYELVTLTLVHHGMTLQDAMLFIKQAIKSEKSMTIKNQTCYLI